jgi:hypothetical protein
MKDISEEQIRTTVLERIKSGRARMHSRAYFVVRAIVSLFVAFLALVVSSAVLSFIIFGIHESGELFLLGFGFSGVVTFFALFPWFLFGFDLFLIFMLEWLLQGFRFAYRFSLASVFAGVFGVSALLALALYATPLHSALQDQADQHQLPPPLGDAYENVRGQHHDQGIYRGVVTAIQGNQFVITHDDQDHDLDDGTWTVVVPPGATSSISVGERVFVFGSASGTAVYAQGEEPLAPDQ